ncbi:hypothetical protein M422DRAFT_33889 [Sphaerobolus stellatus SS14]|uniref:Uncharacterized protein n=1 Tax=Sphaerobolus stellatus (strain SS14) TaxID=990650 RepID=A0A0C9VIP5_SPHS4|nr:hypothetical protein M422DRAFT_33889 [Sphaerobolus stellatus SS14]
MRLPLVRSPFAQALFPLVFLTFLLSVSFINYSNAAVVPTPEPARFFNYANMTPDESRRMHRGAYQGNTINATTGRDLERFDIAKPTWLLKILIRPLKVSNSNGLDLGKVPECVPLAFEQTQQHRLLAGRDILIENNVFQDRTSPLAQEQPYEIIKVFSLKKRLIWEYFATVCSHTEDFKNISTSLPDDWIKVYPHEPPYDEDLIEKQLSQCTTTHFEYGDNQQILSKTSAQCSDHTRMRWKQMIIQGQKAMARERAKINSLWPLTSVHPLLRPLLLVPPGTQKGPELEMIPLHVSGETLNRVDFVIFADGYVVEDRNKFLHDAEQLAQEVLQPNQPLHALRHLINFWGAFTLSENSGIGVGNPQNTIFGLFTNDGESQDAYMSKPDVGRQMCAKLGSQCDHPIFLGNVPHQEESKQFVISTPFDVSALIPSVQPFPYRTLQPSSQECAMRPITSFTLNSICKQQLWLSLMSRISLLDHLMVQQLRDPPGADTENSKLTLIFRPLGTLPSPHTISNSNASNRDTNLELDRGIFYSIHWEKNSVPLPQYTNQTTIEISGQGVKGNWSITVQLHTLEVKEDANWLMRTVVNVEVVGVDEGRPRVTIS